MTFNLYNSITKQIESFSPKNPDSITFYSCGPTVYDDAHIGNFRSFLAADLLRRWIESPMCKIRTESGETHEKPRKVTHVMNITDVGHMTDDDNADGGGEDKMEVAAQRIKQAQTETKKDGSVHKAADIDPNDPRAIARFYEQRFKEDAIALGLKVAIEAQSDESLMPRASEHVEHMKQVITDLLNNNHAYTAGAPGSRAIYFNTQTFPNYGSLSGNTLDQLKGGAGGRVDESQQSEKKHPADFLLWKEDSSHKMKWDAPDHPHCYNWDQGYPGWHIECTAMALARLVPGGLDAARATHATIDLHSGGEDNIFPHHECEIAQSCCFTHNQSFARHWFHARFLKVEGEKMSKSKGTMYTLRDLTNPNNILRAKPFDPSTVRLELIKTHYRANADFSMQGLTDSERMIKRWRLYAKQLLASMSTDAISFHSVLFEKIVPFSQAMSSDMNIAMLLAQLNRTVSKAKILQTETMSYDELNDYLNAQKQLLSETCDSISLPSEPVSASEAYEKARNLELSVSERSYWTLHLIDYILGVIFRPIEKGQDTGIALYQPGVTPSEEIESLLQQRADAKKSKDFATADAIRDQLSAMNLSIMDKPGGKVEVAPIN
jgi:cysteinyl-tRNA synthetase